MLASPRTVLLAASALLATGAAAQAGPDGVPAAIWAAHPAEELPHHLHELVVPGKASRDAAVLALAQMGPRAHRWLAGALRLRNAGHLHVVADAFGGFGPASAWALPILLENLAVNRASPATLELLSRLGGAAKPASALLQARPFDARAKQLAEQLAASPDVATAFEPMPEVGHADGSMREPLLAVLRDPAQHQRWWPALQALVGIDAAAAQAAAEVLVLHHAEWNGPVAATSRELLLALRCYCAATALGSLDTAAALPEPHRARELALAVLASCAPLHLHPQHSVARANARRLLAWAATGTAAERRLAALSAAMYSVLSEEALFHEHRALIALQADADTVTRELAAFAGQRSVAAFDAWLASGTPGGRGLDAAKLDPEYLQRIPAAVLERVFEVGTGPAATATSRDASRSSTARATEQVLRSAQTRAGPGPDQAIAAQAARDLIAAVATKAPALLAPFLVSPEANRRALASLLAARPPIPTELHEWWLDQQQVVIDDRFAGDHLPIEVAPALLGRLRRGERLEHTLPLLHTTRRYTDWHELMDKDPEAFAAAASRVPASLEAPFAELVTTGWRRRVAERLLLAGDTTPALRTLLVKHLRGADGTYPPSDTFVLACVQATDPELASLALVVARYATDSREQVAAILLERLPAADAQNRRWIVHALRRLESPAAEALLREQLRSGTAVLQCDGAIALASAAEPDAEAMAWLRAGIASEEVEQRRQTWRGISFSVEVAPRFVEDAVAHLTMAQHPEDVWRLETLLKTAAKTRRADVIAVVERLSRHRDEEVATMAVNMLQQFEVNQQR